MSDTITFASLVQDVKRSPDCGRKKRSHGTDIQPLVEVAAGPRDVLHLQRVRQVAV